MINKDFNWKEFNGENTCIAVIDTGIKLEHHDFKDLNCESYYYNSSCKKILKSKKMGEDNFGHGTACSWIIHRKLSKCKIISIKALDENGVGSAEAILSSLDWCIENNIKIINLSLGTYDISFIPKFEEIGKKAKEKNVLIFASAGTNANISSIPARLNNYICVDTNNSLGKYDYYFDTSSKKIYAKGGRQRVGWIGPDYIYISGSSFATAHMSSNVAILQQQDPNNLMSFVEECSVFKNKTGENNGVESADPIIAFNSKKFNLGHALIINLNKESCHFYRFRDSLDFSINHIVNLSRKRHFDLLHNKEIGLTEELIINGLNAIEKIIDDYDTVIISRTHIISEIESKDIIRDILELSIKYGKNVYSLEYIDYTMYPDVWEKAAEKGIKIRHPMISKADLAESQQYIEIYGRLGTETPVVGVFGTGTQQGKFTVQMTLRNLLKKKGYKVYNLGTEIQSELFGFEATYPMEIDSSIKFDQWNIVEYLQGQMRKLELKNPDIIITGSQSGIIPTNYAVNSRNYTLPSIGFLMGTLPHAYILTVNFDDDINYIKQSINVLESIGKGKVILLVFNDYPRVNVANSSVVNNIKLSSQEIETIQQNLEETFFIPATEVVSDRGKEKLAKVVLEYFSN